MKFINLPSLSLIVADVPERLRGSTRNRIRNACVGSNPAVCALLFFLFVSVVGKGWMVVATDGCLWDDLTFGKDEGKKREKFRKKKRKKNIIATKIHHLLVRTSRKEVRERALSLSSCLSRKSRSVSFPRFLDARKRVVFPAFFFSRARPHTPHARVVGRLPAQKEQKKTRKIIAPTGTRATRLADSTRAKRGE